MASDRSALQDTGERMIPTRPGEVSVVFSRHEFAYLYAKKYCRGKDVIDVGCGTGYGCKILSEDAEHVIGLDHDESAINYCREKYSAPNVEWRVADAENLDLESRFDVVTCFQVIEHMRDADDFVDRLKKLTRPGGLIVITTPNVKTRAGEGEGNPFHFSEMSYGEFQDLLQEKFQRFDLLGIGYAKPSMVRELLQKLPFYSFLGRLLRRGSTIKKAATRRLKMTEYRVVEGEVESDALDLLAVCYTPSGIGSRPTSGWTT